MIEIPPAWNERFRQMLDHYECEDEEDLVLRALSIADVIAIHLSEPGAEIILRSPSLGEGHLDLSAVLPRA